MSEDIETGDSIIAQVGVPFYNDALAQQFQALEGLIRGAADAADAGEGEVQAVAIDAIKAAVRKICGAGDGNIREIKKRT